MLSYTIDINDEMLHDLIASDLLEVELNAILDSTNTLDNFTNNG